MTSHKYAVQTWVWFRDKNATKNIRLFFFLSTSPLHTTGWEALPQVNPVTACEGKYFCFYMIKNMYRAGDIICVIIDKECTAPWWFHLSLFQNDAFILIIIWCLSFFPGHSQEAKYYLSKFSWGHSFLELNSELLDLYAACENSAAVIAAQNKYLEEAKQEKLDVPDLPPYSSSESEHETD